MKIYRHEFDPYVNKITTREIEVAEKPQTYTVMSRNIGFYERVVRKSELGVLQGRYTKKMFTLTPSKTDFLNALINSTELQIKYLTEELENRFNEKTYFSQMLGRENKESEA